MKRYIHRYLSENYKIGTCRVTDKKDELFDLKGNRAHASWLIKELGVVFDLDQKKLRGYVKSWWKENDGVGFASWWLLKDMELKFKADGLSASTITFTVNARSKDRMEEYFKTLMGEGSN
jgi:hypothetical protein